MAKKNPEELVSIIEKYVWVWRCASLARGLALEQPTMLYCVTDGWRRLQPTLLEGYFGNVIFTVTQLAEVGKVNGSLADGGIMIQAGLEKMDGEYFHSALDYQRCSRTCRLFRFCSCFLMGTNSIISVEFQYLSSKFCSIHSLTYSMLLS